MSAARQMRLRIEIAIERYGWVPWLSLLLFAGAGLLQAAVVPSVRREAHDWRGESHRLEQVRQHSSQDRETKRADSMDGLPQALFPAVDSINPLVTDVFKAAETYGLQLEQSRFQYGKVDGLPWTRIEISVPVTGPYPSIRQFAETVLRDHPNVALDQLSFKRETARAAQVEVVVGFSAWFDDASGKGRP